MQIFTDGSFSKKPNIAGVGYIFVTKHKRFVYGDFCYKCNDNNISEVFAIYRALKTLERRKDIFQNEKTLQIITDSDYAIKKIQNYEYQGKDDFEIKLMKYIREQIKNYKKIDFMLIKGHVHNGTKLAFFNNMADKIAGEQRKTGLQLIQIKNKKMIQKD